MKERSEPLVFGLKSSQKNETASHGSVTNIELSRVGPGGNVTMFKEKHILKPCCMSNMCDEGFFLCNQTSD